jgi:hypothetical protein
VIKKKTNLKLKTEMNKIFLLIVLLTTVAACKNIKEEIKPITETAKVTPVKKVSYTVADFINSKWHKSKHNGAAVNEVFEFNSDNTFVVSGNYNWIGSSWRLKDDILYLTFLDTQTIDEGVEKAYQIKNLSEEGAFELISKEADAIGNGIYSNLLLRYPTDKWLGRWIGVEGEYMDILPVGVFYKINVFDMDGNKTSGISEKAANQKQEIIFYTNQKAHVITAGTGEDTGMKWLAGENNCLIIEGGINTGFCK